MSISEKEFLDLFGWNNFFDAGAQQFLSENENLVPARIIGEERDLYRLQSSLTRTFWAQVSGKKRFESQRREDFPAVGDWVLCTFLPHANEADQRALIHHILPRKTILRRKQAGDSGGDQNIAANVDYIFIATSMNDDLNLRRLERYLTIGWDSGAQPVLLLTKSDLNPQADILLQNLRSQLANVPIHTLSVKSIKSFAFFDSYMKIGKTSVVVGSSGVGKSTLINLLIGQDILKTQKIREGDAKGRHTTTSRYLFQTCSGGLIIDTPGMRELQLLDHEDGLEKQFSDIEELMLQCKFTDCMHKTEPGCKISAEIKSGGLKDERWQSYLKLKLELSQKQHKIKNTLAKSRPRESYKKSKKR